MVRKHRESSNVPEEGTDGCAWHHKGIACGRGTSNTIRRYVVIGFPIDVRGIKIDRAGSRYNNALTLMNVDTRFVSRYAFTSGDLPGELLVGLSGILIRHQDQREHGEERCYERREQ